MLLVTRVDSRRVLGLGIAGLVPAALVTLLLVHQPSIGDRRLYPLLRGPLAVAGLALAVAAAITWATAPDRLSRTSLTGLAWAGVAAILTIGPVLESTPRARLYALELASGDVTWATSRAGAAPVLVDGDLVVTDVAERALVGLDPETGRERWRHAITTAGAVSRVTRALAAGALAPLPEAAPPPPTPAASAGATVHVADGGLRGDGWSVRLPGERLVTVAVADDTAYAYVVTPGSGGVDGGAIVAVAVADGAVRWRAALPPEVAVGAGTPALGAGGDAVVVAGGERIAVLDAGDGRLRWSRSVVELGKSRGYALPGAVQQVTVAGGRVYLSTTPDG